MMAIKASTTLGFRSGDSTVTGRDLLEVAKLVVLGLLAWTTPPRWWRRIATIAPHRQLAEADYRLYQQVLGSDFDANAAASLRATRGICNREARIQILGLNRPWRAWRPELRLTGLDFLHEALAHGNGAILWVTESSYSTLMVKMALDRAGYRACQLSRPTHGFSTSRFGVRFLNRFWVRVENRFIAERLLIMENNTTAALATLRTRLAANAVVIITVASEARRLVEVPFLHHRIRLPTGPILLAKTTGAVLLPAFASALAAGRFEVSIESPLPSVGEQEPVENVAVALAKRIEQFVTAHPEQWTGWDTLVSHETTRL
jgi:hypothetical protein